MDETILAVPMPSPSPPPRPPTLDEIARARIKIWLRSTGTTQTELAKRIDRTQAWMSRYLSGGLDADLESLRGMAATFGHSLAALLDTPTDPVEAQLIDRFRALRPEARTIALALLQDWAHPPARKSQKRSRG